MIEIRPTEGGDVPLLVNYLHPAQRNEVIASHGEDVRNTVDLSIQRSSECYSIFYNNKLFAIAGIVPESLIGEVANPWLLTTEEASHYPRLVLTVSRKFIDYWLSQYSHLYAYVDSRYTKAVRWAQKLGFHIHPAKEYGPSKELFHLIEMRK